MKLHLLAIATAVQGSLHHISEADGAKFIIKSVSTDSRESQSGLFIPLPGEFFNGHDFIEHAIANGANAIMSEQIIDLDIPYILVPSTHKALLQLAHFYQSLFQIPIIGVTGSVGKTSTKDAIASVLSQQYKTLKTIGNFNNTIGLPLTVFRLDDTIETAVIELGINQIDEMDELLSVIVPNIGVITNIENVHIEYLGDKAGVLKEKRKMMDAMTAGAILLNQDDYLLNDMPIPPSITKITFGIDSTAFDTDFFAAPIKYKGLGGLSCQVFEKGVYLGEFSTHLPGRHMIYIILPAIAVGRLFQMSPPDIQKGLDAMSLTPMRLEMKQTKKYFLICDYYNASLVAIKSALEVLHDEIVPARKVAILGDMRELGSESQGMHQELGSIINHMNIDLFILVGEEMKNTFDLVNKEKLYFKTKEDLLKQIDDILKPQDTILLKAARGLAFEDIDHYLTNA